MREIVPAGTRYEIDPRGAELGGSWRLCMIKNGEVVDDGVFRASETEESKKEAYAEAMAQAEN